MNSKPVSGCAYPQGKEILLWSFRRKPIMERLLRRTEITEDGCWLYHGRTIKGYGRIWNGKETLVHRFAWMHFKGAIPKGLFVLHKCVSRPNCWNPDHLYIGTAMDNASDKKAQGHEYDRRGESNSNRSLTDDIVRKIKSEPKHLSSIELAKRYPISAGNIRKIRRGTIWAHIQVP